MADVSRRDLFGRFLRRPVDEVRARIPDVLQATGEAPAPKPPASPARRSDFPRRLRPETQTVRAAPDAAGRFVADLTADPLAVGDSRRVVADDLAEPLVLVRVNEEHVAAATGECPVDGSDLLWQGRRDVLWCPGCGSQWRLDGSVVRGPARRAQLALHVDEAEGIVRIDVP